MVRSALRPGFHEGVQSLKEGGPKEKRPDQSRDGAQ